MRLFCFSLLLLYIRRSVRSFSISLICSQEEMSSSESVLKIRPKNWRKLKENLSKTDENWSKLTMNQTMIFVAVAAVFLLLTPTTVETRATFSKHSLSRTRRTVTGLQTKCIPYLKNFCQWFTVRGVTKQFCII